MWGIGDKRCGGKRWIRIERDVLRLVRFMKYMIYDEGIERVWGRCYLRGDSIIEVWVIVRSLLGR